MGFQNVFKRSTEQQQNCITIIVSLELTVYKFKPIYNGALAGTGRLTPTTTFNNSSFFRKQLLELL